MTAKRRAPGPWGLPLSGNFFALRSNLLQKLEAHCIQYGDVVRYRIGAEVYHILSGPEPIRYALNTHKDLFSKNTRSTKEIRLIVQDSVLTNSNEAWYRSRRLMQPAFKKNSISEYNPVLFDCTRELAQDWRARLGDNPTIDIHHEMVQLTYRIVLRSLMGTDLKSGGDAMAVALEQALQYVYERIEALVRLPFSIPTPARNRFLKCIKVFDDVVESLLKRDRLKQVDEQTNLLELLVQAANENEQDDFSDQELRNELLTLLLAGHETTANALTWCFYLLSRHPEIQTRLADSIKDIDTTSHEFINDTVSLQYVMQVFNETMRLYPPVWAFDRLVEQEVSISGYRVKKHSEIIVCPYTLHRNPAYWPEPSRFDPDRFEPGAAKQRDDYSFIPFGKGPRMCVGMNFAFAEAFIILTKLVQEFEFSYAGDHELEATPGVTLRPSEPVITRVAVRRK